MHECIPSVFTVGILHGQLFSKSGQKVYKRFIILPQTAPVDAWLYTSRIISGRYT